MTGGNRDREEKSPGGRMSGHLTCHCRNAGLYRTNLSLRNGQTGQFPDSCLKTSIRRGLRHFVETFFCLLFAYYYYYYFFLNLYPLKKG